MQRVDSNQVDRSKSGNGRAKSSRDSGFTLIELMIVIVIIGILVTVALPVYENSVRKAKRAEAKAALIGFSQAMERHYGDNYSYVGAATSSTLPAAPLERVFSARVPVDGDSASPTYNLSIQAATDTIYTLRATPVAGTTQADDGVLEINHLGRKSWDRDNNSSFSATEHNWDD
ncbi:MAG: type IV pilin protein [Parahaliea sp.]